MRIPITKKKLYDWAGRQVVKDAETMVKKGLVVEAEYEAPYVRGSVLWNNRPLKTSLKILPDGNAESKCPCYMNRERGLICSHVIAIALAVVNRTTDPLREAKYQEEIRRASRLSEVKESEYIKRVPPDTPGAKPAKLKVTLRENWLEACKDERTPILCELEYRGKALPLDQVPRNMSFTLDKQDESVLFVLEDISEGPARGTLELRHFDLVNLLKLYRGRSIPCADGKDLALNETAMITHLKMDLNTENGELTLSAHTELPFMKSGSPLYIIAGKSRWAYGADNFWPLEKILPAPYHGIYREPVTVSRPNVLRFLQRELVELSKTTRVESNLSADLFTIDPGSPRFRLTIKGSPASLAATLYARYDGTELVACKPDAKEHFGIPDPGDLMRYTVRNLDSEKAALIRLSPTGFSGDYGNNLSSIVGNRQVLNFLASHLPALRRKGWEVQIEGRIAPQMEKFDFVTPVVRVADDKDEGWFDVGFEFEDGKGGSLSHIDIQEALRKGDSFLKQGERIILIDADAVESMQDVFADCATGEGKKPGHFRMSDVYASFVKSSLDALDGIDIEDTASWRNRAGQFNRTMSIESIPLGERLNDILRPYQKEGVNWLRFLEVNGFCGLLADEMGLGKTLETLVWLQLQRHDTNSDNKPALIICPTSLVENWAEEAAKFVPEMKVITLTGSDRHEKWKKVKEHDLAVTSYAILRRDIDTYLQYEFSAAILDEAQHIKNRATQNAYAAKQIKANHRLVLTGTPIENSVSDLWSIMDFLMPGYLGGHDLFKDKYERPIAKGDHEGEMAQVKLRRKLHPFLLRRLKTEVAKDLPPKIEKVSMCTLTTDQAMVYDELLNESQRKITNMVNKKGFNKSRMEILTLILRLRQTCCHLGLIDLPGLKPEHPSAKTDLFLELLDEAMDGGHRMLVFSQFVSMLTILRGELDKKKLPYCYLDGSTKNRQSVVKKFNTERDIPLFLISLKAGGTGLNLTGADIVVHFDPWWNPAVEDQATDRAHRIGQKRTVYSVKLITRNTIEEKVLAMQNRKKAIIDATIESADQIPKSMKWEDIQDLLAL